MLVQHLTLLDDRHREETETRAEAQAQNDRQTLMQRLEAKTGGRRRGHG